MKKSAFALIVLIGSIAHSSDDFAQSKASKWSRMNPQDTLQIQEVSRTVFQVISQSSVGQKEAMADAEAIAREHCAGKSLRPFRVSPWTFRTDINFITAIANFRCQ